MITPGTNGVGVIGANSVQIAGASVGGGTTNGTFGRYANPALYSPPLATSDTVYVSGTSPPSSYTVTFGAPASNVRIYLASFASKFTFGNNLQITKVSGDAVMLVSGNIASGVVNDSPPGYDTNGILALPGTLTSFTFTAEYDVGGTDGIYFQIYACE
jgi:hypothetical protein